MRKNPALAAALALSLALALVGCGGIKPAERGGSDSSAQGHDPALGGVPAPDPSIAGKSMAEPGELDRLLDAKPIDLAALKSPSQPASGSQSAPEASSGSKGKFRIQIGAESDMDAAQAQKAAFEKKLGGTVDVVFDAPYYKLRWGYFDSKQDAEDKLLELSDQKIQGFVVK